MVRSRFEGVANETGDQPTQRDMLLLSDFAEVAQEIIGQDDVDAGIGVHRDPPPAISRRHSYEVQRTDKVRWVPGVQLKVDREDSIEVGILLDEPKPSGKPDLSVVGVPGFPGLVLGSSASVGFHDSRSLIIDGGLVN